MPLYQTSVLKKYLKQQDTAAVAKAHKAFIKYFHNPHIQENIRSSKEEEYQGIFLTELFVNVLGYTMKPQADYNLVAEYKNEKNSKKADGAILKDEQALGVIELKGTNTRDLESVRQQAFDYKANQSGCIYVVTSNFEKVRFYINNAVDFEEFDLFSLTLQDFELMWLCLAKDNLLNNVPLKIKEASIQEEEEITKEFYSDYSLFKRELFRDLVRRNMKNAVFRNELNTTDPERANKNIKQRLFQKSQKLIDRFLFIFFAEDRGLLPPNSTKQILDKWKADNDFGDERPLFELFKQYFKFLDIGRQGTTSRAEIFAYNGGLFKPDTVLDSLNISNNLLYTHTHKLQAYDFESKVDVNILGHIFENSLNEIESINAEIEGKDFDKQKTKRKKDGVFYTPKYITKYIVDNTVGKLCSEKKAELKLVEDDYLKSRKGRTTRKLQELQDKLDDYRNWLLRLTICDPACGSGAFLNQALDYLIKEHAMLDELKNALLGGGFLFPDIENTILENNIYGVDINEESVEIAKLSLWLRTAQPRRKLNNLSSNIKCGNSLIDSKAVAGNKAFSWEQEFPQVFQKGGFDVVIGNPPYVPAEYIDAEVKRNLEKTYASAYGRLNLYPIFYEKGIQLLRKKGILSFITPYTILKNQYYVEARRFILSKTSIQNLVDFKGVTVFHDAAVDSIILTLKNEVVNNPEFTLIDNIVEFQSEVFAKRSVFQNEILRSEDLSFNISLFDKLISRISKKSIPISSVVDFKQGIITGGNSNFISQVSSDISEKVITGSDFNRYTHAQSDSFILYNTKLHRPRKREIFEVDEKILLRQTGSYPICTVDSEQYFTLDTVHNGLIIDKRFNIKYIVAILNSKLIRFLYENSINETGKVFAQVKIIYIDPLPIKLIKQDLQNKFTTRVDQIMNSVLEFGSSQRQFIKYVQSQYNIEKLSRKLQNWHDLSFGAFINELNKALKKAGSEKLTKLQEMEWMDVFETKKAEAQTLKAEIKKTDKAIDAMVYELYGLTEEEIGIVEGS